MQAHLITLNAYHNTWEMTYITTRRTRHSDKSQYRFQLSAGNSSGYIVKVLSVGGFKHHLPAIARHLRGWATGRGYLPYLGSSGTAGTEIDPFPVA